MHNILLLPDRLRAESSLARAVMSVLLLAVLLAATAAAQPPSLRLVIRHGRTGEELGRRPIQAGEVIRFSWIHSVELTPWEEYYRVLDDGRLVLVSTRFQSYGAGVPEDGGEFRKEKDWMIRDHINRELPCLSWLHSRTAGFRIAVGGTVFREPEDLPHHEPLKLIIEQEIP